MNYTQFSRLKENIKCEEGGRVDTKGRAHDILIIQALLDALRTISHSPAGTTRGNLSFGLLETGDKIIVLVVLVDNVPEGLLVSKI